MSSLGRFISRSSKSYNTTKFYTKKLYNQKGKKANPISKHSIHPIIHPNLLKSFKPTYPINTSKKFPVIKYKNNPLLKYKKEKHSSFYNEKKYGLLLDKSNLKDYPVKTIPELMNTIKDAAIDSFIELIQSEKERIIVNSIPIKSFFDKIKNLNNMFSNNNFKQEYNRLLTKTKITETIIKNKSFIEKIKTAIFNYLYYKWTEFLKTYNYEKLKEKYIMTNRTYVISELISKLKKLSNDDPENYRLIISIIKYNYPYITQETVDFCIDLFFKHNYIDNDKALYLLFKGYIVATSKTQNVINSWMSNSFIEFTYDNICVFNENFDYIFSSINKVKSYIPKEQKAHEEQNEQKEKKAHEEQEEKLNVIHESNNNYRNNYRNNNTYRSFIK